MQRVRTVLRRLPPVSQSLRFSSRLPPLCSPPRRYYATERLPDLILKPPPPPPEPEPIQLRSYQEECIDAVLKHTEEGHRRMGVSLATGGGKTVIFTQLISRLHHPERPKEATRTLIIAHRTELVQQAFLHCRRQYPEASIEIEMAKSHASGTADITIASISSLISRDRLNKFDPSKFKLVLIDEAHHAVAASYLKALDYFGLLNMDQGEMSQKPVLVGVSATLSRFDGLALGKVLDIIVYHRDYTTMIEEKWLSPVKFTTVKSNVDLSRVSVSSGDRDFKIGELSEAVNTNEANEITVRTWLHKAHMRKSTLVFCVDIAHVNEITAKFREYGIDARPVTSHTSIEDRKRRLQEFRRGDFRVLVNCGVFTEGTDIPNIDCVLLARPTRSRNLLIQMIGRGMRLHNEKEDCHVIDMVCNVTRGVMTVPTLLGLDPDEMMDDETVDEAKKRIAERPATMPGSLEERVRKDKPESIPLSEARTAPPASNINVTFTNYDSVQDLLLDAKQDSWIRSVSMLAWVSITPRVHVMSLKDGHIKIVADDEDDGSLTWSVTVTQKLPFELKTNPHMKARPRELMSGIVELEAAIRGADSWVLAKYPWSLVVHTAPWRSSPATESQVKMCAKFGVDATEHTKGQAADMITRWRNGSLAHFDSLQRERKRREKIEEKESKRKQREEVRVGPLRVEGEAAL